jgi:hypothetical protein
VLADATWFKSNTQTHSLSHESYLEWITLATISEQNPTHLQQSYDIHLLGQEYSNPESRTISTSSLLLLATNLGRNCSWAYGSTCMSLKKFWKFFSASHLVRERKRWLRQRETKTRTEIDHSHADCRIVFAIRFSCKQAALDLRLILSNPWASLAALIAIQEQKRPELGVNGALEMHHGRKFMNSPTATTSPQAKEKSSWSAAGWSI